MIDSKNKSGFSLVEVLFTIAIISMAISPLLILQARSRYLFKETSSSYKSFVAAYSYLLEQLYPLPQEAIQKKQARGKVPALEYRLQPLADASTLKIIPHVQGAQVIFITQPRERAKRESLVTFLFVPEKDNNTQAEGTAK